jgi:hypothetical protein
MGRLCKTSTRMYQEALRTMSSPGVPEPASLCLFRIGGMALMEVGAARTG